MMGLGLLWVSSLALRRNLIVLVITEVVKYARAHEWGIGDRFGPADSLIDHNVKMKG
jgi:hypothetical protein